MGDYFYNKNNGALYINLEYTQTIQNSTVVYTTHMSIYNYKGGVLGGRIYLDIEQDEEITTIIQEFLSKDFYKKAKMGYVKDKSKSIDMENTTEDKIAVYNKLSDQFVFDVIYDNQKDGSPQTSTIANGNMV